LIAMAKNPLRKKADDNTSWQPAVEPVHSLILKAILTDNPIPLAYRINYVANFYVGPLVGMLESSFKVTRAGWIVLFCLTRRPRLNAQQISIVTGRPKTSVAAAVKELQRKKLITKVIDAADGRRQVLHLTAAGKDMYQSIVGEFIKREKAMLQSLTATEKQELTRLFDKIIRNSVDWAKPY
jgi:DNA-binding MarR family transcriptional regulator